MEDDQNSMMKLGFELAWGKAVASVYLGIWRFIHTLLLFSWTFTSLNTFEMFLRRNHFVILSWLLLA